MTMSEYILEQSISTATCFDIEIERSLAEMNVLAEMCACYEKAEIFAEYASDPSVVAECGIFLEADDKNAMRIGGQDPKRLEDKESNGSTEKSKKKNLFTRFLESIKTALSNLWKKFLDILEKIMDAPMQKALDQIPPGTIVIQKNTDMHAIATRAVFDTHCMNEVFEEFIRDIKAGDIKRIQSLFSDKNNFKNSINTYIKNNVDNMKAADKSFAFTKEEMLKWRESLKRSKKIQKTRAIMKEIESITDINESFGKADISVIKGAVHNISSYMKESIDYITYVYNSCIKMSAKREKIYNKTIYGKVSKPDKDKKEDKD